MANYDGMTDDEIRALNAQQAQALMGDPSGQLLPAPAPAPPEPVSSSPDMSQLVQPVSPSEIAAANAATVKPTYAPAVNMVPPGAAAVPESAPGPDTMPDPQSRSAAYQRTVSAPEGHRGNTFDKLANLSNANTAATLQGLTDNQGEVYRAMEQKSDAERKAAELQAKTDTDIARLNQAAIHDQQEQQAQAAIMDANRKQDVKIEMDKYDEVMRTKVDPDGHWKDGLWGSDVTANKITSIIGLALAGAGGQAGNAINAINGAIDRDIRLQNDQIARKADAQRNIVGLYKEQYRDGLQADLAAKMAMQQHAFNVIEQRRLNAKPGQDLANLDKLQADMKVEFTKTQSEFLKLSNAVVSQGILQQGNLANMKDESAYRSNMLDLKANAGSGASSKLYVPGAGYAVDEDSAKKARDAMQVQNSLDGNLKELAALRAKHNGGFVLDRQDVARGHIIKEQVKRKLQKLYEMGVLQAFEEKSIDKLLPDADAYSPMGSIEAAYDQIGKSTRQDTTRKINEYINPALSFGKPRYETVQETVIKGPTR
jgi:hypothetical protein